MVEKERFYNPELYATRALAAFLLGLDHSGSVGIHMDKVIAAAQTIYDVIENDPILKGTVQLTVTAFNEQVDVIKYPDEPNRASHKLLGLKSNGGTNMHSAKERMGEMLLHSVKEQQKAGCVFNGAFMGVITDGDPTDHKSATYDKTMEYLKQKGIKLIAIALPGADLNWLNKEFDTVIPISDVNNLPTIMKAICQTILPAISQSRPGDSLKFKFGTNEGVKVLDVEVNEIVIEDDNPIIDVRG